MNLILLEFNMLFKRKEFKIIFYISLTFTIIPFLMNLYSNYGKDITTIFTANQLWFGLSGVAKMLRGMMFFLLPLFGGISYSDTYFINGKQGFNNILFTRADRKKCMIAKAIVVFFAGFVTIFIPLMVNQILCVIAFPTTIPIDPINWLVYDPDALFAAIRFNHPYLYNILYMIIPSMFSGAFALLSYGISFAKPKNRLTIVVLPFIVYSISDFILGSLHMDPFSLYYNISSAGHIHSYGIEESYFIIIWCVLVLIPVFIYYISFKKRDEI